MLVLSRKLNESIMIDGLIEFKIVDISANAVKVGIEAPMKYHILRKEIFDMVLEENRQATKVKSSSALEQLRKKHTKD